MGFEVKLFCRFPRFETVKVLINTLSPDPSPASGRGESMLSPEGMGSEEKSPFPFKGEGSQCPRGREWNQREKAPLPSRERGWGEGVEAIVSESQSVATMKRFPQ
jgi:hypothetical protein